MFYMYAPDLIGKRSDGTLEPLVKPRVMGSGIGTNGTADTVKQSVKPAGWSSVDTALDRLFAEAADKRAAERAELEAAQAKIRKAFSPEQSRLVNDAGAGIPCRATSKLEEALKVAELHARMDERSKAQAEAIGMARKVERSNFREELRRDIYAAKRQAELDAPEAPPTKPATDETGEPVRFVILPVQRSFETGALYSPKLTERVTYGRPLAVYRDKAKAEAAVRLLRAAGAKVELVAAPLGDA